MVIIQDTETNMTEWDSPTESQLVPPSIALTNTVASK